MLTCCEGQRKRIGLVVTVHIHRFPEIWCGCVTLDVLADNSSPIRLRTDLLFFQQRRGLRTVKSTRRLDCIPEPVSTVLVKATFCLPYGMVPVDIWSLQLKAISSARQNYSLRERQTSE